MLVRVCMDRVWIHTDPGHTLCMARFSLTADMATVSAASTRVRTYKVAGGRWLIIRGWTVLAVTLLGAVPHLLLHEMRMIPSKRARRRYHH